MALFAAPEPREVCPSRYQPITRLSVVTGHY